MADIEYLTKQIESQEKCIKEIKEEVNKVSSTLFGDDGIVSWARDHIEAEQERKEIYKELRKKLAVRGALGAVSILLALLFYGIKSWLASGGKLT